jgi:glycosyltransferase involved in cell wall biosynthesis
VVEYFKKQIIGLFNSALVAGREQSSYLESLGMPHSKISLGFDVVDNKHFSLGAAHARKNSEFLRRRLGLPARYFLLCNRLVPVKNIETVIVAFASFHKNKAAEGWQLIIAGHGRMREMLVQFAQERGVLNDIQFRGAETYEQLPVLYGLAEAFILPSWSETWGLVVNEAMAAGLPVIVSTHVGCVHELVQHGSNGYIFNPNDADRLSELMLGLAKNDRLRAEMRRCSERIISDWDLSRFVEGILLAATNATSDPVSPATRTGLSMAAGLIWR